MKSLLKKITPLLPQMAAFLSGALLVYGFSPYSYATAGIASPAIFLWCLANKKPRAAFGIGFCYGLGLFGFGVNWIYVSIHVYGDAAPWLATSLTGLFVATLSLFPAAFGWLLNRLFPQNNYVRILIAYPTLWVLFEMLRGFVFSGFPWAFVGYSQISNHLRAFAPVGSVWLVSFASVLISAIFYGIIDYYYSHQDNKKARNALILALPVVWGIAFSLSKIEWTKPNADKALNVALVQGNIAQEMRWDRRKMKQIIETYSTLTEKAMVADLIIWPEGAIPLPIPQSNVFFQEWHQILKAKNIGLIAGVPVVTPDQQSFYNALIGIGKANGVYYKKHLVPFGEYVPLERWLRGLIAFFDLPMSDFIEGETTNQPLRAFGLTFSPAICYEIAYPVLVQQQTKQAPFILTVSNDTWFGTSIGPWQHLQIARFRALEHQKPVIRATNTGLTAFISPKGKIKEMANQFSSEVLFAEVTPRFGQTPWSRFGIWPLLAGLLALLALGVTLNQNKTRPKRKK